MNEEKQPIKIYGPAEAAKYLGVPQPTLARLRREGKVKGERSGTTTIYLQEDLDKADLSREKPGPKTGPNSRLGRARYEWPGDGKGTSESSSSVASVRKNSSRRHAVADLVGV